MQDITHNLPDDIDKLKAIILDSFSNVEKLENNVSVLESEKTVLKSENTLLASEKQTLEERIKSLIQQYFGRSSEKFKDPRQGVLFNEIEQLASESVPEEEKVTSTTRSVRRGKRKPLPAELKRENVIHDIPDDEKFCQKTGEPLFKSGEEISEQLDIVPAKIHVIRHIKCKYACRCCDETSMVTSKAPAQPIAGSMASAGLLAYIAVSKFVDALPLYRQEQVFKRIGVDLPRSTMARWMIKVAQILQPLMNLIKEEILESSLVHADETTLQVLKEKDKAASSKSYMWVLARGSPNLVLFEYHKSRSSQAANHLLDDYKGYLMVDGYVGYKPVSMKPGVLRLGCWAHARRYFFKAVKVQKKSKKPTLADEAMEMIRELYKIDKHMKALPKEERLSYRVEHAGPLIDKIREWCTTHMQKVTPSSLTGKALHYLNEQWPHLIVFLKDDTLPLDNNYVENLIRSYVIGRKNWLFADTPAGADASANIYSLLVSAKINNIEPYQYIRHLLKTLPTVTDSSEVESMMPHKIDMKSICAE